MLVVFVVTGTLLGLGVVLILGGVFARAVPLEVLADERRRPTTSAASSGIEMFAGDAAVRHAQDLAVCDRTPAKFAADRLINTVTFAFFPGVAFVLAVLGIIAISPLALLVVIIASAGLGWYYTTPALKKSAAQARTDFDDSLSSYFELVSLAFAGGKGPDEALRDSAMVGTGRTFQLLRSAMAASYERHEAPWVTLLDLGQRLGAQSLIDLGASITLAADGAPVGDALRAKADTMREKSLSAQEARAEAKSESMSFPIVLMMAGFLILAGYPALAGLLQLR